MDISKETLHQLFSSPFDLATWQDFLHDCFGADNLRTAPVHLDVSTETEDGFFLGDFKSFRLMKN